MSQLKRIIPLKNLTNFVLLFKIKKSSLKSVTIIKIPPFFYSVRDFKSENKDNLNENSKSKIASIQKSPRKDYFGFIIMKIVGDEGGVIPSVSIYKFQWNGHRIYISSYPHPFLC